MADLQIDHSGHHHMHLDEIVNHLVSRIAPFSGLIMTVAACVVALLRLYVLDLIFIPRVYSAKTLSSLHDGQRRSFVNHHVAAATKIVLLIATAYPLLAILVGNATPHTPYAPGSKATLGDVMIVCSQIFSVMYIFELFYRDKVSPISCAHHVGAIVIAQSAVAMSINFDHEKDAVYEFILCFIWGGFDVFAELWPHIAMILYRVNYHNHRLLASIFRATMIAELVGTVTETAVVMWLFGSLWHRWSLPLKIVTPFLHILFSAAQLWGARVFRNMARLHTRKAEEEEAKLKGGEIEEV